MRDLETVNKATRACAENAHEHLKAARELRKTKHNNMSFNAAVLALEEIGKAILIGMTRGYMSDTESPYIKEDWVEDHTKKLFWAIWAPSFGKNADTVRGFKELSHAANNIHERRLNALYVNPATGEVPEHIPDEEVDAAIALAEHRVETQRNTTFEVLNEEDRSNLSWFLQSSDDPELVGVIFCKDSFARLTSYKGDVRQWVLWLRTELARLEEVNQRLADEELTRTLPSSDDELKPKWSLKVRLRSMSHSVRPKSLSQWNRKSRWVTLSTAEDRRVLLVRFLVPQKISIADLSSVASGMSNSFALALNIATRGFFWWYLPAPPGKFFDEIRDLERDVPLAIDSPSLKVSWGNRALVEEDLEETLLIYTYLGGLARERWEPYMKYLQGLALVAKNDIHGRFEPTIVLMFYQAFKGCALDRGDWDGSSPFIDAAKKGLEVFRAGMDSIDRELDRHVQLGEMLLQGVPVPGLTLRDAIMMKLFCDLYISRVAHESLGHQFAKPPTEERKP
jgi:AbiV family abortive infection protein